MPLVLQGDPLPDGIRIDTDHASSMEQEQALEELLKASWDEGYLTASIDSLWEKGDTLFAMYHRGEAYEWGELSVNGSGEGLVRDAGIAPSDLKGERIAPEPLSELFDRIISHCEQNGYPFAELYLDSVQDRSTGVRAQLKVDKGPLIRLDSVIIKGDRAVHRSFLKQYLGLDQGMIYDDRIFRRIDDRLRSLSFLGPSQASELLFTGEGVTVYLYLKEKDASRFNGMVGMQPKDEGGGVVFTGDVTLGLKNALGRGEHIELDWNRMQQGTQDLEVSYDHPYLFRTPFGIETGLKLYRRDSSFTELKQRIALKYLFTGEDHFQVHYERKRWTLLEGGERSLAEDLPYANVRIDAYGLGINKSTVDRRVMPRKGIRSEIEGSVGRKELLGDRPSFMEKDQDLDSNGTSLQYEVRGSIEAFYPLLSRLILMGRVQGAYIQAPYIVQNELYRIGGHASLRGVDKEAIRASAYSIATLEFRYLLEAESDVHLFFDGAYHEDRSGGDISLDRPFGFGVGSRFKTGAGIFNIDYALGKRFDNPIRLRNGRVHFGFTSLF